MAGANSLRLWLLTDGAPGHWSQSQGIADALAEVGEVEVLPVEVRVRSAFWKRLGRICLRWIRHPRFWLARTYELKLPEGRPDLIISSGANTLLANALLARQWQVPNAYSGTLKGYAASAYRVVFTVVDQGVPNNCVLPLPPVPASLQQVPALMVGAEPLVAVLVGGDGAGYRFREEDWQAMAAWLKVLVEVRGARLLLTTSRRTGAEAEQWLKQSLPPACLAQAVWWSEAPQPVVRDFLGRASAVVVTEDSLTMVAESIYSRRPVYTLSPAEAAPNDNDGEALGAYAEARLIRRVRLAEALEVDWPSPAGDEAFPDVPALIRAALQPCLPGRRLS